MQASITGEWRHPTNTAADQQGGIHDDDTATDLGFRGCTVAGFIQMEQFAPILAGTASCGGHDEGSELRQPIARMLKMDRILEGSSPLWREAS